MIIICDGVAAGVALVAIIYKHYDHVDTLLCHAILPSPLPPHHHTHRQTDRKRHAFVGSP